MASGDLRALKREFDSADQQGNGYINAAQLRHICVERGLDPSNEDVRDMLSTMDIDDDGKVSFREFCAFHHKFADPAKASQLKPFQQRTVSSRPATASRPFTAPAISSGKNAGPTAARPVRFRSPLLPVICLMNVPFACPSEIFITSKTERLLRQPCGSFPISQGWGAQ